MAQERVSHTDNQIILRGRWLSAARTAWVVLTLGLIVPALANIPPYIGHLLDNSAAGLDGVFREWTVPALQAATRAVGISSFGLAAIVVGFSLLSIFLFAVVGLIIFFRRSDTFMGLLTAFIMVTLGTGFSGVGSNIAGLPAWGQFIYNLLFGQIWGLFFIFFTLFPDGRFVPRWTRWLVPAWILVATVSILVNLESGGKTVSPVALVFPVLAIVSLGSQVYRYQSASGPLERQQIRWFAAAAAVFGLYWVPLFALSSLHIFPALDQLGPKRLVYDVATLAGGVLVSILLPISIAVALLRYHLWDLDFIIRRTLLYALLSGLLGLVYFGSVLLLRQLLGGLAGESSAAVVISTLLIAALFSPLRRRLQTGIDRRFYRQKYDAARALEAYSSAARSQVDLEELTGKLVGVVQETVQPERISLWLKKEKS